MSRVGTGPCVKDGRTSGSSGATPPFPYTLHKSIPGAAMVHPRRCYPMHRAARNEGGGLPLGLTVAQRVANEPTYRRERGSSASRRPSPANEKHSTIAV